MMQPGQTYRSRHGTCLRTILRVEPGDVPRVHFRTHASVESVCWATEWAGWVGVAVVTPEDAAALAYYDALRRDMPERWAAVVAAVIAAQNR